MDEPEALTTKNRMRRFFVENQGQEDPSLALPVRKPHRVLAMRRAR